MENRGQPFFPSGGMGGLLDRWIVELKIASFQLVPATCNFEIFGKIAKKQIVGRDYCGVVAVGNPIHGVLQFFFSVIFISGGSVVSYKYMVTVVVPRGHGQRCGHRSTKDLRTLSVSVSVRSLSSCMGWEFQASFESMDR